MAVSVPGRNAQETRSTATWPPKRIVSSFVSRTGCSASGAGAARAIAARRGRRRSPLAARRPLALVADRDVDVLGRNLAHEIEHVEIVLPVLLDPEVIHRLHRLMVFLAEGHRALGRLD